MRQTQIGITGLFSTLIFLMVSLVQSMPDQGVDYAQKADQYVQQEFDAGRFAGSVIVAKSNRIVFMKGYGLANREHNIANSPKTKFRLASLTKQFTAMCILHLQDQGKLNIEDTICKYVPDCPNNWHGIKIEHLMGHSSGITNFSDFPDYLSTMMVGSTPEKTIDRFRDKPLEFEPGARFAYSNSGYVLLGRIVEIVSGRSYEQYVSENIFKPLSMEGSGYDHADTILSHRASGYSKTGDTWVNAAFVDMSIPHAAGGLYSTVEDFFQWYRCWREQNILSASSWRKMTTAGEWHYGFGMWISEYFRRTEHKVFEHGGHVSGFATSVKWFPDADLLVAAFANCESAHTGDVAENLAAIMLNMPVE